MAFGLSFRTKRSAIAQQEPHEANLFDMDSKYGDVVSLADALAYLEELKS